MPRTIRPANSSVAEDPIQALGNMVRAGVIGYLREHPNATRAEVANALEIDKLPTARALSHLVEAGLVVADPPRAEASRGQRIRYRVDDSAVSEMYLQLGQAIGEI